MSLREQLAAFDDTALEALASKGVVRRARRDLDAGRATIVERDDATARVDADGQSVVIDARGPAAARCDCPATGVCRHVVLAVMALREHAPAPSPPASAAAEICALPQADLERFAGAHWTAATALAADEAALDVAERGTSCVVVLKGTKAHAAEVTFIPGQGLRGAAYKGPKTRRRVSIAAAALRLRMRAGLAIEPSGGGRPPAGAESVVSDTFLAAVHAAIEQGVAAVLPGRSPIAADGFLDLAISTRAESLPRVAAELRRLAHHASLAAAHDAAFDDHAFLIDAARAYALVAALRANPQDSALTGRVRRDYAAGPPLELWMLAAARWRTDSGARGVTAYGFSPDTGRWHAVHQGRAGGADPSFDPASVYRSALWGAGALCALIGKTLHVPEPWLADDGAIAPTLPQPARVGAALPGWDRLVEADAASADFAALRGELGARIGLGLRRSAMPLPALILPASFGRCVFDELDQTYRWDVVDRNDARLVLELPARDEKLAERLPAIARRIRAIVIEAAYRSHGLAMRPVTLYIDDNPDRSVVNLCFDELPRADLVGKALERVRTVFPAHTVLAVPGSDPLESAVSAALDAAAAVVEQSAPPELERIAAACESCGLMTLAAAVRRLGEKKDVRSALWAGYVAGEAHAALQLAG